MKNTLIFLISAFIITCSGCNKNPTALDQSTNQVYQYGTIQALLEGHYDGEVSFSELAQHGDFGLGTFNRLDGEMLAFDGRFFQVKSDGKAYEVPAETKSPFAVMTRFQPDTSFIYKGTIDFAGLQRLLDQFIPSENLLYAIKMHGEFSLLKTRSVTAQSPPYRPLGEVVSEQSLFDFDKAQGTMVAFRFPQYTDKINVPGYHFHFISEDLTSGGHVLGFESLSATIELDYLSDLHLALPSEGSFHKLDLTKDRSDDLEKVEKLRN